MKPYITIEITNKYMCRWFKMSSATWGESETVSSETLEGESESESLLVNSLLQEEREPNIVIDIDEHPK